MTSPLKQIEPTELDTWLKARKPGLAVIDVREPHETAAGVVSGSILMPLATVPLRVKELNPNDTVVFVCRSGARSSQACSVAQRSGIKNAINLRGGVIAWVEQGMSLVPPTKA